MRSMFRFASAGVFALSIALGTIGAVSGVAQAAPAVDCPWTYDIFGNPVCQSRSCGYTGLKHCQRTEHYDQYGNYIVGGDTCDCVW